MQFSEAKLINFHCEIDVVKRQDENKSYENIFLRQS